MEIDGLSGKITVERWHTGGDFRVMVYNQQGNSVYIVLDEAAALDFANALLVGYGQVRANRAMVDISTNEEVVEISAYDVCFGTAKNKAWFSKDCASRIAKSILEQLDDPRP